jgi:hypothetical protein
MSKSEVVPKAQGHVLEAGHFAPDSAADEIADLVRRFRVECLICTSLGHSGSMIWAVPTDCGTDQA